MQDVQLVVDLVIALGAAFVGGMIAQRVGLPVLVGYVLAGIFIGPNTPGLTADFDRVQILANLGVAFLMFALGVEFSLGELRRIRRIAGIAGGLQIPITIVLGVLVGLAMGWELRAALLLGGAFAISSSIVAIKLLSNRGEAESPQARAALGLSIVQDLSLVPMLALLPLLAGETDALFRDVLVALGTTAIALITVLVLGLRVVPQILYVVARTGSRELFLLCIVMIALGTAYASYLAGLSIALGAFFAGLIVSESEFDNHVLSEIIPLRDVFATLFFVALGMFVDPAELLNNAGIIAVAVVVLVLGKLLIAGGAFLAAGLDHRTAALGAAAVAQIGEFSFVLAGEGFGGGVITLSQYNFVVQIALGSMLISPLLLATGPILVRISAHLPGVARQERAAIRDQAHDVSERDPQSLIGHVVICGYGRVGRVLGESLEAHQIPYAVIELNPAVVRELRARGIAAFYGDSASESLLRAAGVERARTIAVTVIDLVSGRATIQRARDLNSGIDVVTRANIAIEVEVLRDVGADEVVQPEFEAGLEFVRHVLVRHGLPSDEAVMTVVQRRLAFYGIRR